MTIQRIEHWTMRLRAVGLGLFCLGTTSAVHAALFTVSIGDNFFNPSSQTINVNDQVRWTWAGANPHSATSNGGLWDSGIHTSGFNFTNTFATAGSFPYHCNVHLGQNGSITVQTPPNSPPSVAISAPTNSAVFAEPWTGSIQATAADSDGTVTNVDFFAGAALLGNIANPGPSFSFTVTNLAAGNHQLRAVAKDNLGSTNQSLVTISVVTPGPIQLSAPERLSASSFRFSYTATPGLNYVVLRATTLPNWVPLQTYNAAGSLVVFQDNSATADPNFYSVQLLPNP